jgi:toxin YoeB
MRLTWRTNRYSDYLHWQEHDRKILQRVNDVIRDALRNPFTGIGKPEPLRNNLKGWWSRRITGEHRLIYKVEGESLLIMQCRFHYDD